MSEQAQIPVNNSTESRFELQVGDALAVAEYRLRGQTIVFTHTEVPAAAREHGTASRLVGFALDDSRQKGYKVVARCPFVASFIQRHPEYADLLASSGSDAKEN